MTIQGSRGLPKIAFQAKVAETFRPPEKGPVDGVGTIEKSLPAPPNIERARMAAKAGHRIRFGHQTPAPGPRPKIPPSGFSYGGPSVTTMPVATAGTSKRKPPAKRQGISTKPARR